MKTLAVLSALLISGVAPAATLFDNGPAVGADGLRVVKDFTAQSAATSFSAGVADNFTVSSAGGWRVTDLNLYSYTNQNTPTEGGVSLFTYSTVTWSIVKGDVNFGEVVASDTTSVTNGGLVGYSVEPNELDSKRAAIWKIKANIPDVELAQGDYWLTWAFTTLAFNAAVTPVSGEPAGDAMRKFRSDIYVPAGPADHGAAFPFEINGSVISAVPEPATAASLLGGLALVGVLTRRRRTYAPQTIAAR